MNRIYDNTITPTFTFPYGKYSVTADKEAVPLKNIPASHLLYVMDHHKNLQYGLKDWLVKNEQILLWEKQNPSQWIRN